MGVGRPPASFEQLWHLTITSPRYSNFVSLFSKSISTLQWKFIDFSFSLFIWASGLIKAIAISGMSADWLSMYKPNLKLVQQSCVLINIDNWIYTSRLKMQIAKRLRYNAHLFNRFLLLYIGITAGTHPVNPLKPRQDGRHFQTIFSNAFSWMKTYKFRKRFHWSMFPRVQLTIFQHRFR